MSFYCPSVLFVERFLIPSHLRKRGIELDKRGVYRAVLFMAGIAVRIVAKHARRFASIAKTIKRPLAIRLLDVCFHIQQIALVVASLIDGTLMLRTPNFQHKDRVVGPPACQ